MASKSKDPEPYYVDYRSFGFEFFKCRVYAVRKRETDEVMSTWVLKSDADAECLALNGGIQGEFTV